MQIGSSQEISTLISVKVVKKLKELSSAAVLIGASRIRRMDYELP